MNQQIRQLEQQKAEWRRQSGFDEQKANNPRISDAEAKKGSAEVRALGSPRWPSC